MSGLFPGSVRTNNWQASPGTNEMGFGKKASVGERSGWTSTSMWGGVACIPDTSGLL